MGVDELSTQEQARLLAQGMTITTFSSTVIALTVFATVGDGTAALPLGLWCAAVAATNLVRWLWSRARKDHITTDPARFLRVMTLGALCAGLAWSALLPLCLATAGTLAPFIIFVGAGISAGAVVQGRSHAASVLAFVVPIQTALFFWSMGLGTKEGYVFAFNIFFFTAMMGRSALQSETTFTAANRLRYEAMTLASSLRQANERIDASRRNLEHVARHDTLTGLLNRAAFHSACEAAAQDLRNGHCLTLMLIDLDRFKALNDTYGHALGDLVLAEVSRRIRAELPEGAPAARLGGDEFAALLVDSTAAGELHAQASRLIAALSEPIRVGHRSVGVGASIGFARYPHDGASMKDVQINADAALYAAKSAGRGTVRAFDEPLRHAVEARRAYELDLADAIARGEIEVWFQPQVNLNDYQPFGFEGLIRWKHPRYGWAPPQDIVTAALETRQSEQLTRFVLAQCCRFVQALAAHGHDDLVVSFNVSPLEIRHYSLPAAIRDALVEHAVEPSRLMVEITEEAMLGGEQSLQDLRAVSALGLGIGIDDFGVAYSSFGALRNVHFDVLKIDRSFITNARDGSQELALLRAILAAARSLDAKVIAEGVENSDHAVLLKSLGCQHAQGYLFGRPEPPAVILSRLAPGAQTPERIAARA